MPTQLQFGQWALEHQGLIFAIGLVYNFWIAAGIFLIWLELHQQNAREQRREWMQNFDREKQK
jgi:hypothetical protein